MSGCVGILTDLNENSNNTKKALKNETLIDILQPKDCLCALDLITKFERNSNLTCLDICYIAYLTEWDFNAVLKEIEIKYFINKLKIFR